MENMESEPKNRSGCLTVMIVSWMVFSLPAAIMYFSNKYILIYNLLPRMPHSSMYSMGLFSLAQFVFAIAIFNWKKWGLYGFIILSSMTFILNVAWGIPFLYLISTIIGYVIMYFLLRPAWKYFE